MHRGLLLIETLLCQTEERHSWTCYSQNQKYLSYWQSWLQWPQYCGPIFGILLSTQRVSTKGKGLDFRRANSSSHRAQWGATPWEASTEDKGARSFFKNALLETQKQFIPFKSKGSEPHGLTELASLLKTKREIYLRWKSRQIPTESYKGTARACRDAFEKQNLSLTWNWAVKEEMVCELL